MTWPEIPIAPSQRLPEEQQTARPRQGKPEVARYQMYIDGKFVDAQDGKTFDVYDPSTEGVIATVPAGSAEDIDRAVKAAHPRVLRGWLERRHARRSAAASSSGWPSGSARGGRELAELETDQLRQADRRVRVRHGRHRHLLRVLRRPGHQDQRRGPAGARRRGRLRHARADGRRRTDHPVELSAADGGLEDRARRWRPAARWCSSRPSRRRSPCSSWPGTSRRSGCRPGVVNIVTGDGPGAGAPLVAHPDVRKIAFTGSAEVGKIIMRNAADQLKRISLELGGKSPNIFFSDADFENAVDGALFGTFINQGEVCSAGSRVLVQRDIYREVRRRRRREGQDHQARPRPRPRHQDGSAGERGAAGPRGRATWRSGRSEAKVAVGGGTPKQFDKGWYVEPTIFYDVDNSAKIAQEEIFGPVMSVIPFEDEADAIRIANDTPYGLAAAVWTRDIFKALRVVKALEAGIVWVNHMQPTFVEAPWGGYKASGFGRELGTGESRSISRPSRFHQPRREADRLVLSGQRIGERPPPPWPP